MTFNFLKEKEGVALVLVLTIVMLLTTVVFSVNYKVRRTAHFASHKKKKIKMYYMARSGTDLGIALLLKDARDSSPESVDSVHDDWAKEDFVNGFAKDLVFDEGRVSIKITDEMAKIKINSLIKSYPGSEVDDAQKKIWENILDFVIEADKSVDETSASSVIDSIIDWLDSNDLSRTNGAESDYYKNLKVPYSPSNNPIRTIGELSLIKGVEENLFNINSFISTLTSSDDDKIKGSDYELKDYISLACFMSNKDGKTGFNGNININTADLPVILSLIPTDKSKSERYYYAKAIFDYRNETDDSGNGKNQLTGTWYKNCPGCLGSGVENSNLIVLTSNFFTIESKAQVKESELNIRTTIERYLEKSSGKWKHKVVYQYQY